MSLGCQSRSEYHNARIPFDIESLLRCDASNRLYNEELMKSGSQSCCNSCKHMPVNGRQYTHGA